MYEEKMGVEVLHPSGPNFQKLFLNALDTEKKVVILHTPLEAFDNDIRLTLETNKV